MKIKKNMMVKVVAGNFKGLSGKILKVIPETQRAIVEGVALTKRTLKPEKRLFMMIFTQSAFHRLPLGNCYFSRVCT